MGDFEMKPAEEIRRIVKKMSFQAGPEANEHLWADLAKARELRENAQPVADRENTRRWSMRHRISRLAVAALIGVGGLTAVVVGVNVGQYYYFEGKQADGTYRFRSEQAWVSGTVRDANGVEQPVITRRTTSVAVGPDRPDGSLDVEQTRKDLEEIDRLRQQDLRYLRGVIETETSGGFHRTLLYDYTLSDGRTYCSNEGDPDRKDETQHLTTAQWDELNQLRQAGKGQDAGTQEKQVKGRLFIFQRQRFILGDGTEVIRSEGTPKDSQ
jgi:hypothetical protein